VTAIGTRSDILISKIPTVRVCGSSLIDNIEPQTFKTGALRLLSFAAGPRSTTQLTPR
jgi:hypothetical protein